MWLPVFESDDNLRTLQCLQQRPTRELLEYLSFNQEFDSEDHASRSERVFQEDGTVVMFSGKPTRFNQQLPRARQGIGLESSEPR